MEQYIVENRKILAAFVLCDSSHSLAPCTFSNIKSLVYVCLFGLIESFKITCARASSRQFAAYLCLFSHSLPLALINYF